MKCPKCGTEWENKSTGGEVAGMCLLSILLFPIGLLSLCMLNNKKRCRCCKFNMKKYVKQLKKSNKFTEKGK